MQLINQVLTFMQSAINNNVDINIDKLLEMVLGLLLTITLIISLTIVVTIKFSVIVAKFTYTTITTILQLVNLPAFLEVV